MEREKRIFIWWKLSRFYGLWRRCLLSESSGLGTGVLKLGRSGAFSCESSEVFAGDVGVDGVVAEVECNEKF